MKTQQTLRKSCTARAGRTRLSLPQAGRLADPTPAANAWRGFVRHGVCAVAVFGVLTAWAATKHVPKSSAEWQAEADRARCDVALVGNSMLGRGIDADQLSTLLEARVMKLESGGSASAWWYLVIKNLVARSAHRPRMVVLFFRDQYLTDPGRRVLGKYAAKILAISDEQEPLIDELVYRPMLGSARYFLFEHWPAYRMREAFRKDLQGAVHARVADLTGVEKKSCRAAVNRLFAAQSMIPELLSDIEEESETVNDPALFEFRDQLPRSLLPHIIAVTKRCGLPLVLVRVKRRRDVVPGAEPERLRRYIADLRSYLSELDVSLIDFTPCANLQQDHYADGDHLNERGRYEFTRLLAAELRRLHPSPRSTLVQKRRSSRRS